jgi:hypothetical protein
MSRITKETWTSLFLIHDEPCDEKYINWLLLKYPSGLDYIPNDKFNYIEYLNLKK